jgi:hypothetical protein
MGTGVVVNHSDTPRDHAKALSLDGGRNVLKGSTVALNFGWFITVGAKKFNYCSRWSCLSGFCIRNAGHTVPVSCNVPVLLDNPWSPASVSCPQPRHHLRPAVIASSAANGFHLNSPRTCRFQVKNLCLFQDVQFW